MRSYQSKIENIYQSGGNFGDTCQLVFSEIQPHHITQLINEHLEGLGQSPTYSYSKISNIFPIIELDGFNVHLQIRDKNIQQTKKAIHSTSLDVSFKILHGEMEIIHYKKQGDQLTQTKQQTLPTNSIVSLKAGKDIVEFHPIGGEDVILLICQGQLSENITDCYDIKNKKLQSNFSTNTKESRLRVYSDFLIESKTYQENKLLPHIFKSAKTEELRWSILKALAEQDTPLFRQLLDDVPSTDAYYSQSLQLKQVIDNEVL